MGVHGRWRNVCARDLIALSLPGHRSKRLDIHRFLAGEQWKRFDDACAPPVTRTVVYRPFPRARQEFGTSIAPCRLVRLAAVQQRRVHGHFTRRRSIFRFKSMVKKNGQLVRSTKAELVRCNISYFIFPQWGAVSSDGLQKGEKKERRENLNSKTLFYKDCSLGSVKNQSNY